MKYERVEQLRHQYPAAVLCRVMDVSESGYHVWRKRLPSVRQQEVVWLEAEIRAAHRRTTKTDVGKGTSCRLVRHHSDLFPDPSDETHHLDSLRMPFGIHHEVCLDGQ